MLPRSSLGFSSSPPNPQGCLYCPCSRNLSLPNDLTSTQCYFISPIVSLNSSTIHLVSFRPLVDPSQTNNTMQFPSIPPIMNQTIVLKKPFGNQSK
ncbi:hypothetical protein BYT27DRAFT_7201366 [Phlegmacium glaucopus]|nr:hypothetical protein BYT27DRAFT_7201366 [Phlegmacium glaucopus]